MNKLTLQAFLFSFTWCTALCAQPTLQSSDLTTGKHFNLYTLGNVTPSSLTMTGANVTWNLSTSNATLIGTADFQDMSSTPYAAVYPTANFAMKFTVGTNITYSLFNLTSSVLEEVANNVGTSNPTSFLDYRTALLFPYSFNMSNTDTYQKSGQSATTITHIYDSFGTLTLPSGNVTGLIRDYSTDNGTGTSQALWWNASPVYPVLQGDNNGVTLWQVAAASGITEQEKALSFQLYPNPCTTELHVLNQQPIIKLEVFNITGHMLITSHQSLIDIAALPAGVYFVRVTFAGKTESSKFIKQ